MAAFKDVTILDGGMSRELMRLEAPFRQPEWSALALMEAPELVEQVHQEFSEAGADVLTTNSYALVPFHIGQDSWDNEGRELIARAGRLARSAADHIKKTSNREVRVAGCLPPIFGSYQPGLFDRSKAADYYEVFVQALNPFVDLWLGETLSLLEEAHAVVAATKYTDKPVWISVTLDDQDLNTTSPALRSGERVSAAVQTVQELGAEALLFNCCQPEIIASALKLATASMHELQVTLQLGAYANAFRSHTSETVANETITAIREDLTPAQYLDFVRKWMQHGCSIVGGCCGIGVDHIAAISSHIQQNKSASSHTVM